MPQPTWVEPKGSVIKPIIPQRRLREPAYHRSGVNSGHLLGSLQNVYAFDPTMGKESHYRTPNIRFFNIGVGGTDGAMKIGHKQAEVMTYKNIVKLTSTENRTIDYLKMDIEGSEVPFFDESIYNSSHLLKRAKQLGVEIHPGRKRKTQLD
ncbi:uncharacterized protein LOC143035126 [Oratosquilla oratoria]|uniref:uncharacterized protein LOC143035126 n=1 Tax=Oratosquilla oratoria TaxID=337810 RepID=UPI003F769445